jgi:hypothetical protein
MRAEFYGAHYRFDATLTIDTKPPAPQGEAD